MARSLAAPLNVSTGRPHRNENFPVASILLAPAVRLQVLAFYRFARAADNIADDPKLDGDIKLRRLDAFDHGLGGVSGAAEALELHAAVGGNSRLLGHAATLLHAFRRDVMVCHCQSWSDLLAYCACSAAPVGRFLLDVHHQPDALTDAADDLCTALQIINHLQDCGDDYRTLGRVYLPADWMAGSGLSGDDMTASHGNAALRHVADLMLDRVEMLVDRAQALPQGMTDRRLACETAIIIEIAARLAQLLRQQDPLARHIHLSPWAYAAACVKGIVIGLSCRPS